MPQPVNVLYLHSTATFGGASKSLIELFGGFPARTVRATVVCPSGQAAEQFRKAGMEVVECAGLAQWDNTRYSHYRGRRWLILLRELVLWPATLLVLSRVARDKEFDLIHANEITLLPAALCAQRILKAPLVVHVRSLQRPPGSGMITGWINHMLTRAQAVIAIDRTVRRTLPESLGVEVIHNGMSVPDCCEDGGNDPSAGLPLRVAMIGGLLRMKGVYEFVAAAGICRDRGLTIKFLLAGENPRRLNGPLKWALSWLGLAGDVRGDLEQYIEENGLREVVSLLGFVSDVHGFYRNIDVLCFPSHLDAAGRPVFEAALHGVPALVAADNPEPDTIVNGETGLCILPKNPAAIADAVEFLSKNRSELSRLGRNARKLAAENFDREKNAGRVLALYRSLMAANSDQAGRP